MITLHDLLARYEAEKQAERAKRHAGLSASALSSLCRKQTAYGLHGSLETDPVNTVTVATVGSMIHVGVTDLWAHFWLDQGLVEVPGLNGTTDVLDPEGKTTDGVPSIRDLKTVGYSKFDRWLAPPRPDPVTGEVFTDPTGPEDEVWQQLGVYAADNFSIDVPTVRLVVDALCREDGRTYSYSRDVSMEWCAEQATTLRLVEANLRDVDPDDMDPPREGPDDWLCQSCPFLTRCWGEQPERDPGEVADVELVLAELFHASQMEKEGKSRKAAAKRKLEGQGEGTYGRWSLKWRGWAMPEQYRPAMSGQYPAASPVKD